MVAGGRGDPCGSRPESCPPWPCRTLVASAPMRRAMAAAGWVVLAAGCEQPRTELVARVDSEIAWGAGRTVQSVTLTVRRGGPTGPLRSARTTALGVGGERRPLPLLVGILPTVDTDTPVWIEVLGCGDPNGCTAATAVVAQRAVVRFAIGQTEEVPLLLASACVGVTCTTAQRCAVDGRCEAATAAQATVRPYVGATVPSEDAGPSEDRPDAIDVSILTDTQIDVVDIQPLVDVADSGFIDVTVSMGADIGSDIGSDTNHDDTGVVDSGPDASDTASDSPPTNDGDVGGDTGCFTGGTLCNRICVDLTTDARHCGGCGNICGRTTAPRSCAGGVCAFVCPSGSGNCDADDGNGCEATLDSDPNNCGRCGTVCLSGTCASGVCAAARTCPTGMVPIPSGTFTMGSSNPMISSSQPPHAVRMTAFCIDANEVTVSAYRSCTAGGCTAPNSVGQCNWSAGRENHPVNCVDWNQARSYCQWRDGSDLPTEAQWEFAGRGVGGSVYPWGSTPPPMSQLCWSGDGMARSSTCPIHSFVDGDTPAGVSDMSGNVSEWVLDWYGPYTNAVSSDPSGPSSGMYRVHRGAAYAHAIGDIVLLYYRMFHPTDFRSAIIGFRCAHSL
jgi:sulfatase modifying factor 1